MGGSPLELVQFFATLSSHCAAAALPKSTMRTSTRPRVQGGQVDALLLYFGRVVAAQYELRVAKICTSSKGAPPIARIALLLQLSLGFRSSMQARNPVLLDGGDGGDGYRARSRAVVAQSVIVAALARHAY